MVKATRACFTPGEPEALESQCTAPPSAPEPRECRRGSADARRTCPAGQLQEGAQRTHPRRRKRASELFARR
eukprot:11542966-Alexandrium_andersonii.AAC.1